MPATPDAAARRTGFARPPALGISSMVRTGSEAHHPSQANGTGSIPVKKGQKWQTS
ncbi:hypothetical protein EMIT0158MI4_30056 [Burkholderia ambifaria]